MKPAIPLLAGVALILFGAGLSIWEVVATPSTPAEIVIVCESADLPALPAAQVAMLNRLAIEKLVRRVDKDAMGTDLPKWAIEAAAGKPLPAWVARRGSKVSVQALPKDETAAMALLKQQGVIP